MEKTGMDSALYIGWDVGGWNCDKNNKSRDALVILDGDRQLLGKPWRGNLRRAINEAENSQEFLESLLALCEVEQSVTKCLAETDITIAIDTPLGFSEAFRQLLYGDTADEPIGSSAFNPYLFRQTEQFLFEHGLKPLSSLKDMIGSQATKGMHVLAKFIPHIISTGVWSDTCMLTAIEAYPSSCKYSKSVAELLEPFIEAVIDTGLPPETIWDGAIFVDGINHEDERDALLCALIAWMSRNNASELAQPDASLPPRKGWIFVPSDALNSVGNMRNILAKLI